MGYEKPYMKINFIDKEDVETVIESSSGGLIDDPDKEGEDGGGWEEW